MPRRRHAPNRAEGSLSPIGQGKPFPRADELVARVAADAEGVIDVHELRACGLDDRAIEWRRRCGRLHRIHQGVYAVGHPNISRLGGFIAAVKACGEHAALSHSSAAVLCGYMDWVQGDIDVTIPRNRCVRHAGVTVHRSALLTRADCMIRNGILVTNPTWTIVALAAVLNGGDLRRAVRRALAERLVSVRGLVAMLDRVGPARGTRALRRILARGAVPTRTELEDVVYDLIVRGGFKPPDVNKPLLFDGRKVVPDFRWPEQQLVLEADGAKWHDHALARAEDAERQALLEAHGESVLRVRWDEAITDESTVQARMNEAGAPR